VVFVYQGLRVTLGCNKNTFLWELWELFCHHDLGRTESKVSRAHVTKLTHTEAGGNVPGWHHAATCDLSHGRTASCRRGRAGEGRLTPLPAPFAGFHLRPLLPSAVAMSVTARDFLGAGDSQNRRWPWGPRAPVLFMSLILAESGWGRCFQQEVGVPTLPGSLLSRAAGENRA
jgi:hypothetical protein